MSSIDQSARSLEPGNLVELYEFELSPQGGVAPDSPLYLHPYTRLDAVTIPFMGHDFNPFPVHTEGWDWSSKGTLPRPTVVIGNIDGIVTALLRKYGDFVGCVLTRRRTYARFLDDGAEPGSGGVYKQFPPDIFSVERKADENPVTVQFELSSAWDAENVLLPRRQILAGYCPWTYRGPECSYVGPPVADKDDNPITATTDRGPYSTTITADSGGAAFPESIIKVASTDGFPASGSFTVQTSTGLQTITYTSIGTYGGSPAFLGCTGGTAGTTMNIGGIVTRVTTFALGDYTYVMVAGIRVYYTSLVNGNTSPLTDVTKWVRDDCSKRVSACKMRFGATNPLPYGGFPGAGKIPAG